MAGKHIVRGEGAASERIVRGEGATREAALLGYRGSTGQNDSQCCGAYTYHVGCSLIMAERV
ncbi:hypothetical protein KDA_14770 [Dictyobacter alpinus]|uniref:Uncharacterized protein n=1 Tax=Dictyobacter alpinus TaxID=2014873 RepID=A0A402B3R6_9CHLR|nr:hypothetical protein [Dictyobacter alpinus]GCE25993.1 hypothetical protein KDA_14770 [Dictyobacter alpinus]